MLKLAIAKFYSDFEQYKGFQFPTNVQQDPTQMLLHEYYIASTLAKKFEDRAAENKEAILTEFATTGDDLRRDTEKQDVGQSHSEQFGSFVLEFTTKRAATGLDPVKLKTELRKAGVKDAIINAAFEAAKKTNKVPLSMTVKELADD